VGPVERLALLGLSGFYLLTVLPNIGDNPIVGGDEGWIVSASAKLAREGTFGSDLFTGFFGAEDHYYFNLPLHHLVLAAVFKVFGVGLVQARLVSALAGLAVLVLSYALGRRLGGRALALGAAALLVLLRLNLAPFTGLTLTDLGATVRYDLVSLPYALGAVFVLARKTRPGPRDAALAGFLLGLACLTQFVGAFFLPPLALYLLSLSLSRARRLALAGVLVAATLVPFLPYAAYVLPHWHDFRGQSRTVEQETAFTSPSFYLDNLAQEPDRFRLGTGLDGLPNGPHEALKRPSARLALYLIGPAAAVYIILQARRGSPAHRLLAFLLVGIVLEFALFESTKRFVYWVVVVPLLCLAIIDFGLAVWRWRPPRVQARRLALAAATAVALVFALEGTAVGLKNLRDAGRAPDYAGIRDALERAIPADAVVVGDNRLWLALDGREVRSLHLLFYLTNPDISRGEATNVEGAMRRIDADYLLLSPLTKEILTRLSPRDGADFARYIERNATRESSISSAPYGPIEVYRLRK